MLSYNNLSLDYTLSNTSFRRLNENPCEALFNDFKESVLSNSCNVFEMVRTFEQLCEDQCACLRYQIKQMPESMGVERSIALSRIIDAEGCTWRLIWTLYEDRLMKQAAEMTSLNLGPETVAGDSYFYENLPKWDKQFRELRLIQKWCELNAADALFYSDSDLQSITDQTVQWQNTLKRLINEKSQPRPLHKSLITKMDPDVATRECRNMDDQDSIDEARFLKICFAYVRSGQIQKALDLCVYCGQSWRAASFLGVKPYNDPNIISAQPGNLLVHTEGNRNRRLWKKMCWMLSENPTVSQIERSIYGSLCGNVPTALASCPRWEDNLWARCVGACESIFDRLLARLEDCQKMDDGSSDDSFEYLSAIFRELEASDRSDLKEECADPFHIVQKYVMLDRPNAAVEYMHAYISEHPDLDYHVLRFMAHVVLVFSKCDLNIQTYFVNGILEAYASALIDEKRTPVVAAYVSFLPEHLQIDLYAKFLIDVDGTDERRFCLALAEDAGLDVQLICSKVVQRIKEASFGDFLDTISASDAASALDANLNAVMTAFSSTANFEEHEQRLINCIQWLLFHETQRAEAIKEANDIARRFLVLDNLRAVKALFASLPADSLSLARRIWQEQRLSGDDASQNLETRCLAIESENCIREHLSIVAYLDSNDAFLEWFEHFNRRRPVEPDDESLDVVGNGPISLVEKTASEHRSKEYEISYQRWLKVLAICTERATKCLYNVVLFPDGGWMKDKVDTSCHPDAEERTNCMAILRKRCLPLAFSMLFTVLKSTDHHKEALQLVDLLMCEDRQLYKEFSTDHLRLFLSKLAECSTEALEADKDFLGYDNDSNVDQSF